MSYEHAFDEVKQESKAEIALQDKINKQEERIKYLDEQLKTAHIKLRVAHADYIRLAEKSVTVNINCSKCEK